MNSSQLQFVLTMLLVIDGIMFSRGQPQQQEQTNGHQQDSSSNQGMLNCEYSGNDGSRSFTVAADANRHPRMAQSTAERVIETVQMDFYANITCDAIGTWKGEHNKFSFKIVCPVEWQILLRVSPMNSGDGIVVEAFDDKMEIEDDISSMNNPSNYPIFFLSKKNELEIKATYSDNVMLKKKFTLSARTANVIKPTDHKPSDSSCEVRQSDQGNGSWIYDFSYPTTSSFDSVLVTCDHCNQGSSMHTDEYLTIICWEFDGVNEFSFPSLTINASCSRTHNTLLVNLTASEEFEIEDIRICFAPHPFNSAIPMTPTTRNGPSQSTSATPITRAVTSIKTSPPTLGQSKTASIVVPIVVVLAAVFLIVALVATIWCKRRNKQTSAVNIRSTVNHIEDTVVYNEIGEQDYNTLFGGKERDDYHVYNVPDRPQGKTSVDRTTVSGSGPYQELLPDRTRAIAAVNRSPGVTVPKHGVADDRHAYQDLRQDNRSVSGVHPNGEMPNQLPSKDTPATENGYQALKTATPDYATLEPSPEDATLEQNDQSLKGTSDISEPPSDKQYDTLQRSLNTVGQPPSAGYGTLKPMNETDADYESPNGKPKTTSDVKDPTRPTEALPINQAKTMHPGSNDDDDYQTPNEPAEDLTNAYQTLDNPGYQKEPDTQGDEYSHLQRSLGAKLSSEQ